MTKVILATMLIFISAATANAGILWDAAAPHAAEIVSAILVFVVGFLWGAVARFIKARAKAANAKAEADRTFADRAAILAEQQIVAAKIQQLTQFTIDYALANIDKLTPHLAPLEQADDMVTGYLEAFERRNPDLAAYMRIDRKSATERLAAGITAALAQTGRPPGLPQGEVPGQS